MTPLFLPLVMLPPMLGIYVLAWRQEPRKDVPFALMTAGLLLGATLIVTEFFVNLMLS